MASIDESAFVSIPAELFKLIFSPLQINDLCRIALVCSTFRASSGTDPLWKQLYARDLPMFAEAEKPADMSWKSHYINTKGAKVKALIQRINSPELKADTVWVSFEKDGSGFMLEITSCWDESISYCGLDQLLWRFISSDIRHLTLDGNDLYVPTQPYGEFLKRGDEIELQWGRHGFDWWRAVVEQISGDEVDLTFTQFTPDSRLYRETAIYGQVNGECGGVRKLTAEEAGLYRRIMQEANLGIWPSHEGWDGPH